MRVEGKGYEVKDGDVLHFLFNALTRPISALPPMGRMIRRVSGDVAEWSKALPC